MYTHIPRKNWKTKGCMMEKIKTLLKYRSTKFKNTKIKKYIYN